MSKKQYIVILFFLPALLYQGCAATQVASEKDEFDCPKPPTGIFTATGVDFSLANSVFNKLALGELSIKTKPEVVSKFSELLQYESFIQWSRCLATKRDGWNDEQLAWQERLMRFFLRKPSPEEALKWMEKDPFPKGSAKLQGTSVTYNIAGDAHFYNQIDGDENTRKAIKENINLDDNKKIRVKDFSGKLIYLEEGKIYASKSRKGTKISYMLKDAQVHAEIIYRNGRTGYFLYDIEKSLTNSLKLPYELEEYKVIIPEDLELSRTKTQLNNGYLKVHIELKWAGFVDMIFDGMV